MNDVDIFIPTLRRPDQLERAMRSVLAQQGLGELAASLIVVDNSPEGSAQAVVEALRPECPIPLSFVHEPRPGVATARNAGLKACCATYIAFLDDDEEAPPAWLRLLRNAHVSLGSAVTFGPVRGLAPHGHPAFRGYLDRFFSRTGGDRTELIEEVFGCGNSMMTRSIALPGPAPFDVRSDFTGGEDDRLFAKLRTEGRTFGWAADAFVYEYAPPHRARLRYTLKRAFCYGQGPSKASIARRDWPGLARCMAIGAGQAGVYGLIGAAFLALNRKAKAVIFFDRALRGAGKILWAVRLEFYGLASGPSA